MDPVATLWDFDESPFAVGTEIKRLLATTLVTRRSISPMKSASPASPIKPTPTTWKSPTIPRNSDPTAHDRFSAASRSVRKAESVHTLRTTHLGISIPSLAVSSLTMFTVQAERSNAITGSSKRVHGSSAHGGLISANGAGGQDATAIDAGKGSCIIA